MKDVLKPEIRAIRGLFSALFAETKRFYEKAQGVICAFESHSINGKEICHCSAVLYSFYNDAF